MNYTGPKIVTPPPGPKARVIIEKDLAMLSPSLTRTAPLVGYRAEGVYVEDIDGNVFLDFGSGIGVTGVGHRHPTVIAAVKKQLDTLVFVNSLDYYTLPQVELAEMLFKVTPGDFPKRVFYSNSGSESIDTAIKMAKWHSRRAYGVGFINGFHGRTVGAMSFTTTNLTARRGFAPLYPIGQFTPYPYCYRCLFNREYPSCDMECVGYLTDVVFKKIIAPDETAFILFEPVQGAGGYIVPPKEFFTILSDFAEKHGILLIADEVQTGYGRTGKMFASQHFGLEPDIITMSKAFANGFPAAATVARKEVMDWDGNAHEGTLNGGPVIMEAAKAVLKVIDEENVLENVRVEGDYLRSQLEELQQRYPIIGDIRGMGLMIGIELVKDEKKTPAREERDRIINAAFSKGLLLMAAGESSLRLIPPMIINRQQLDMGLTIMEDCLKEL
ncbi:MAG: aminotransferase class III-fold pyridoxal phosphate-dependent enzyme [Candidatus Atribacteria bacterium]|nr:MAG: aminotransferase class III-fold pyridoxal phosphate-dependent enzyme [Candidatus Atribacteria bacterium]